VLAGKQTEQATTIFGYTQRGSLVYGEALVFDKVEAHAKMLDEVEAKAPDGAVETVRTIEDETGLFDIGGGLKVSGDFTVPVEAADGSIEMKPVWEIMKDLQDDLALEEAVKVCSI